jgi:predicted extracellular nuclease
MTPSELRNTQLDAAFAELNQIPGNDWKYVLTRKNDPEDVDSKRQNVGVAWNQKRVKLLAGPDKIDVEVPSSDLPAGLDQGSYPWRRPPYAWHFAVEGKTDFVLIPLHWKSNSDGEDLGKTIRALEGKSLAEEIDSVKEKYSDQDIVVLGDTNCKSADEAAISALTEVGFKDLNADDLVTYMSGTSPFDRFIVSSDDDENSEFRYSRQYALIAADRDAHDRALSDHFMILMAFRPMDDDD